MGSSYDFDCRSCGYKTHVSGGEDAGMVVVVETCTCLACHNVVDVIRQWIEGKESVDECPECQSPKVEVWNAEKRPCPKCGASMKFGDTMATWD